MTGGRRCSLRKRLGRGHVSGPDTRPPYLRNVLSFSGVTLGASSGTGPGLAWALLFVLWVEPANLRWPCTMVGINFAIRVLFSSMDPFEDLWQHMSMIDERPFHIYQAAHDVVKSKSVGSSAKVCSTSSSWRYPRHHWKLEYHFKVYFRYVAISTAWAAARSPGSMPGTCRCRKGHSTLSHL